MNVLRLPASSEKMTAEQACSAALADAERGHLVDVIVFGYDKDGELYVRSSAMTRAEAFFLNHKAARWAAGELE
jgi:uncharacterized ParB-like nuclease family protein